MTQEHAEAKNRYLEKYIFNGLKNSSDGFDVETIPYFDENEFKIVLARVKQQKSIGIYGIEVWKDGEFLSVDTFENYNTYPQDFNWYECAFSKFKNQGKYLYSASFYVPGNYLEFE